MNKTILIIEDNSDLSHILKVNLEAMAWETDSAGTGDEGLEKALSGSYDLIILDLMLPGIGGLEVLKRLRSSGSQVPILILTSKSSEMDRVIGLDLGADDYVTKPFSVLELQARIKAIFRRLDSIKSDRDHFEFHVLSVGDLSIEEETRTVRLKGKPIELTAKEFDLLHYFAMHPGRVFTRAQLLDAVWGYGHGGYEHTVNSHINRLRAKIEAQPDTPEFILTVWGVGYKFNDTMR